MKKIVGTVAILIIGGIASGCTNYLYHGSIKAEDSAGKQRQVVLYWSKTDPLIGDEKSDMAHVLTECGSLVVFENQPEGIVFRRDPQRDRIVNNGEGNTEECGRILGVKHLTELGKGKVSLTIQCKPVSTEFSVKKRTYIKAQKMPYDFEVREVKNWSFLGKTPPAPAVPACTD